MQREFRLEQGVIDLDTGEFPARVATNGEATDGHILDVQSMVVGERVPMFINHDASPVSRMGSLSDARKSGKSQRLGGATLHMRGRIDMQGDSAAADIRRDVAQGIHVGDITAMSARWDEAFDGTPRSQLAKSHFAFREDLGGWNTPLFIRNATIIENSIVGLGADKAALVGRSQDLNRAPHVRAFYAMLVNGDTMSREQALTCLYEEASRIDELESIETASGAFYVPRDVAVTWGQSIEADEIGARVDSSILDTLDDTIGTEITITSGELDDSREEAAPAAERPEPAREEAAPAAEQPLEPVAAVAVGATSALERVEAYRKQREAQSDSELNAFAAQLLYKRRGTIQNGQ